MTVPPASDPAPDAPATDTPAGDGAPPAPQADGAAPTPSAWSTHAASVLERGGRGMRATVQTLAERRGLRTVLLGLLVAVVALVLGGAIAVPLLLVGLVMIVAGAMGPRLGGHVGLDFGPEGTSITFNAQIAPPGRRLAAAPTEEATEQTLPPRPRIALAPSPVHRPAPAPPRAAPTAAPQAAADVDSTGETMEIDAADLRARLDAEHARGSRTA